MRDISKIEVQTCDLCPHLHPEITALTFLKKFFADVTESAQRLRSPENGDSEEGSRLTVLPVLPLLPPSRARR